MTLVVLGAGETETGGPDPARVISGQPVFTIGNGYGSADGKRFAGTWTSTPGAWRITYDEWEYCEIQSGISIVTHDDGRSWHLRPGDRFVIEPGFSGVWEVVEATTKTYVVILP